jgi:2-oxoglutarate ferredoxin oxidoreductase subunit delta
MVAAAAKTRAKVIVHRDLCKGCGLCVHACPQHLLEISEQEVNRLGYYPVRFAAESCSGCGVCFQACPEPDGLTVVRQLPER